MPQTDNSSIRDPRFPLASIAWTLLILAALYICYFHRLGAIGFLGPDEPRYASIAREMAESGDWITPRLFGKPWLEKPILYYWAAAASFKLFGVNEAAARLPSAVAALLATLGMAWLAWRIYDGETARWLLVLLPTTVGMIGFSHAAATDMPFAALLTIAMVFATRLLGLDPSASFIALTASPPFTSFFFGFFLGLAVLAKGPAAVVLAGGTVVLWAALGGRWHDAFRCLRPIGLAGFSLAALPWYLLCGSRNPQFFRVFIIEHNFRRYLTPEFQHIQPFWFYLPIILLAIFPWTLLLIPAAQKFVRQGKERHGERASELFLLSWVAFPLIFFSVSQSKLPGYILPAVPALLLVLTKAVLDGVERAPIRWPGLLPASGLLATALLVRIGAAKLARQFAAEDATRALGHVAVLAAISAAVVALLGLARSHTVALFVTALVLLSLVARTDRALAELDRNFSARSAAEEARKLWPDFRPDRAATWQLKRSLSYQLDFYTHADLPEWVPPEPRPEWLFIGPGKAQDALLGGFICAKSIQLPAVIPCRRQRLSGQP